MIGKNIFLTTLLTSVVIFTTGCGSTSTESNNDIKSSITSERSKTYNDGSITLWNYLVPANDTTNNYIKTTGTTSKTYTTRFITETNKVTEISDLSENEKTIYIKNTNDITVLFYTDGAENGRLELKPTVDIGDIVTIKKSDCTLVKYWDVFHYGEKNFNDVIEIKCGDTPGYYQKDVGEILQKQTLAETGTVITKYLSSN